MRLVRGWLVVGADSLFRKRFATPSNTVDREVAYVYMRGKVFGTITLIQRRRVELAIEATRLLFLITFEPLYQLSLSSSKLCQLA
jgi:hypothetical protein